MRISIFVAVPFALSLGALSLPGCGGDTTTAVTAESACASLAKAICGRSDTCSPFTAEFAYGDVATCEARVTPRCLETPDLAGATVTPEEIQACADAYSDQTCSQAFAGVSPEDCRLPGEKADGATCAVGVQCKGGACRTSGEGQCGACATPLAAGATCDVAEDVCDAGLFCSSAKKCESPAEKGQACTSEMPCEGGLSCNGGICGSPLPEGGDCGAGQTCDLAAGLFCNSVSKKCTPIGIAKLGEACGFDQATGGIVLCEADVECDFAASTCIAKLKEGDACTIDADSGTSHCATGFQCVSGKCSTGYPTCN